MPGLQMNQNEGEEDEGEEEGIDIASQTQNKSEFSNIVEIISVHEEDEGRGEYIQSLVDLVMSNSVEDPLFGFSDIQQVFKHPFNSTNEGDINSHLRFSVYNWVHIFRIWPDSPMDEFTTLASFDDELMNISVSNGPLSPHFLQLQSEYSPFISSELYFHFQSLEGAVHQDKFGWFFPYTETGGDEKEDDEEDELKSSMEGEDP